MARALHKVQKQISKKRGAKPTALHENSRDAQRLRQAGAREDKLQRIMAAAAKSNDVYVTRVAWMREAVSDWTVPPDDSQLHDLVKHFIDRDNEELAELQAAQRPGRPRSKAEERIRMRIDAEQKEYEAGFWTADLRNQEVLDKLSRWGGDWGGLNNLKFVRIVKNGEVKASSFPPKGLS